MAQKKKRLATVYFPSQAEYNAFKDDAAFEAEKRGINPARAVSWFIRRLHAQYVDRGRTLGGDDDV